jgi:mRNA-degrading endonuclease toxin of MazEF toxin-antitoxin module
MAIYRGDIFFVELGPTIGHEIDTKRRPVLVISINDINSRPLVVTVTPGSTLPPGRHFFRKNEVQVDPSVTNGLTNSTVFKCIHIRAIDHSRFDQPRAGQISRSDLVMVEQAVRFCLGLP